MAGSTVTVDQEATRIADERARFLLDVHRPVEALALVNRALAHSPSVANLHTLRAECHLALNDLASAERAIGATLALGPATAHTCGVATRVALAARDRASAATRASMYREVAPLDPYAWYLTALVAAYQRNRSQCEQAIATCLLLQPEGPLASYAGVETALVLGGRRRLQRANVAVERLIAQRPADGHARRLGAELARRHQLRGSQVADKEIRHLAAGAALGVQPKPFELRDATRRAVGPKSVAISWAFVVVVLQGLAHDLQSWWLPVPLAVWWVAWIRERSQRSAASIARLPAAGRQRVAGSAASAHLWCGFLAASAGGLAMLVTAPWNEARAVDLGLGHDSEATIITIVYETVPTRPSSPTPLITRPGPIIPRPTSPAVGISRPITRDAPVDRGRAVRILRQLLFSGAATIAVGSALVVAGLRLRRSLGTSS